MTQKDDQKIPVIEWFGPTIQGEGLLCGHQTYFVRLGGCDYRCTKCDSMHAVDGEEIKKNATYMTALEIADVVQEVRIGRNEAIKLWTISGGNPALWDLKPFIDRLHEDGCIAAIETQGTYYKPWINDCDFVTISPKSPGMGERFLPEQYIEYIKALSRHPGLNIKIVVFSSQDVEFALEVREMTRAIIDVERGRMPPFFLSVGNPWPPGTEHTLSSDNLRLQLLREMRATTEELLQDPRCAGFIFLPQLHVLLWGNKQGV